MRVLQSLPPPETTLLASRYRPRLPIMLVVIAGFGLCGGVSFWAYQRQAWDYASAVFVGGCCALMVLVGLFRVWQWATSRAWVMLTSTELIVPIAGGGQVAFPREEIVDAVLTVTTYGFFKVRIHEGLTLQFSSGYANLNRSWFAANDDFSRLCDAFDVERT